MVFFQNYAKNVTLNELDNVSRVFLDLANTLMDSKDDILMLANTTFWRGLKTLQETSNDVDQINNVL